LPDLLEPGKFVRQPTQGARRLKAKEKAAGGVQLKRKNLQKQNQGKEERNSVTLKGKALGVSDGGEKVTGVGGGEKTHRWRYDRVTCPEERSATSEWL